ncbi:hypothetical protein HAX54_025826, partial [Datura stramonium]|nr:hypothetical protein [Datura stramonium]
CKVYQKVWGNSKLKILDISFNRLKDLSESLGQLFNLESFNAPYNLLEALIGFHVFNKKLLAFHLVILGLIFQVGFRLKMTTQFCSLNSISNTMPSWLPKLPPMITYLNISYNQISGKIQDFLDNNVGPVVIDFSSNNFSRPLPRFSQLVGKLHVDNNQFFGSLNSICKIRSSTTLDLFENLLSGEILDCWTLMSVPIILNIANNRISGSIPYSLCSSTSLSSLYVRNNNLSGQFPVSLKKCQGLKVLDLGRNTLSGKIPEWIGTKLAYLGILSLRFNEFSEIIPPSICQLQSIRYRTFLATIYLEELHIASAISPHCNFCKMVQV